MFKKIVIGFDGSEHSERALRMCCDLAQKYDSEIHLVHTPHAQTVAFAMGAVAGYRAIANMPSTEEVESARDKILSAGEAIAKENGQTITKTYTELGDPAEQIVACAESVSADLIITGRRGLGSVSSLLLGSTTQSVNHSAKCACLSIV